MTDKVDFTLDGKRSAPRRARPSGTWPSAKAHASRISAMSTCPATGRTATAAPAWSRSTASACWPPRASASRRPAWWSRPIPSAPRSRAQMVFELLASNMRPADAGPDDQSNFWNWASSMGIAGSSRFASKFDGHAAAEFDITNPAIAVNLDACIALRRLRARLPRGAGQRRHRHGRSRRPYQPGVRLARPDGLSTCVSLRRVRAGLPDRRADGEEPDGQGGQDPRGGRIRQGRQFALPLLRRRLPDARRRQGQQDPPGRRPQRARQRQPPVRQGPLRLRLCHIIPIG